MKRLLLATVLALCWLALRPRRAQAHQPFFVDRPTSLAEPWPVADPTVATVLYATLAQPGQVDYYTFGGLAGLSVRLGIIVPFLAGLEAFAPWLALVGPGLPPADLPAGVETPAGAGALVLPPAAGPAERFEEPHSGRAYWRRQRERLTLPADGPYYVVAWSPEGGVGRYVLSLGEVEVRGGDSDRVEKMRSYWTPLAR